MAAQNGIIIVDTNIVFSALLNPNSKFTDILLKPESRIEFYSTTSLLSEIESHKNKIKKISGYTDSELQFLTRIITTRIKFFEPKLLPEETLLYAERICRSIDPNDSEFVALTEHTNGLLWTGDKKLIKGLLKKGWDKFISTEAVTILNYLGTRL